MEVSDVRRRIRRSIEQARQRAQARRQRVADAERAYATFLEHVATPLVRQVASALKAEGYPFTVSTPGNEIRLAFDHTRDDAIEIALDTSGEPHVVGRVRYTRGSRTIEDERPLKSGASPEALTEEDMLEFLARALETWLER